MGTTVDKVLRMTLAYTKLLIVINVYMNYSEKPDLNIMTQLNFVKDSKSLHKFITLQSCRTLSDKC